MACTQRAVGGLERQRAVRGEGQLVLELLDEVRRRQLDVDVRQQPVRTWGTQESPRFVHDFWASLPFYGRRHARVLSTIQSPYHGFLHEWFSRRIW